MVTLAVAYGRWEDASAGERPESFQESAWAELLFQIDPTETSMGTNSAFYDPDLTKKSVDLLPDREGAPAYIGKYAEEYGLGESDDE